MDYTKAPLSLTQLRTFAVVAEVGNFTRAAELLRLTQPAVTQQIRALADHFGVPLFEMVGRSPVLTEAGVLLAERAAAVLSGISAVEREMQDSLYAKRGTIELGATLTIGNYALMPLLGEFHRNNPGATLHVVVGTTANMVMAVKQHRLAVALVEGPLDDPSLHVEPYATDELVVVVPARGHRLSGAGVVQPNDLAGEVFITREGTSGTRSFAAEILREVGVEPTVVLSFANGEGISRAVEAGLGIALLSKLIVARSVEEKRLHVVRIADVNLRRQFKIIRLPDRLPSPLLQRFIDLLKGTSAAEATSLEPRQGGA